MAFAHDAWFNGGVILLNNCYFIPVRRETLPSPPASQPSHATQSVTTAGYMIEHSTRDYFTSYNPSITVPQFIHVYAQNIIAIKKNGGFSSTAAEALIRSL